MLPVRSLFARCIAARRRCRLVSVRVATPGACQPMQRVVMALASVALLATSGCVSEQDARDELAKKAGCTIVSVERAEGNGFDYTLHCEGDQQCKGTLTIKKGFGSRNTSSFESCQLRDEACKDGAAAACMTIASRYLASDANKARSFYDRACNTDPEACRAVGDAYFPDDNKAALAFYRRGCDKPDEACALVGDKFLASDEASARGFYDKACEATSRGCSHAGLKFKEDKPEIAAVYFEKGCTATPPNSVACFYIAVLLDQGRGVAKDLVKSRQYNETGCETGNRDACNNLGVMLVRGEGGPRDPNRGLDLFEKACSAGSDNACETLDKNCNKGIKRACDKLAAAQAAKAPTPEPSTAQPD